MSAATSSGPTLTGELEALVPVALHGLAQMQDARSGLFSHKASLGAEGKVTNQGVNPLYTGACIIGLLSRQEGHVEPYASRARQALDALLARSHERDPAVLGTLLWGCVLAGRADASRVAATIVEVTEPSRSSSMQLGLAVSGLARWMRAGDESDSRIATSARDLARELQRRFVSKAHVFAATGRRRGLDPGVHRLTSFASQVYPVQGLCELALATDTAPPSEVAQVCNYLMESQGERGQWWWFYSTRARKVIEGYPVYSVHQDAMAFLAMLPAIQLLVGDYRPALIRGLRWVTGDNELGESLVDPTHGLIYRAIQRRGADADGFAGWSQRQRAAVYLAAVANRRLRAPRNVEVLRECRSYHLGWLLLAAAMALDAA